uniref:Uncharacterized protein n=1 Tax=Coccidioides posadasii RMSCC 3488 TaxID=454284 RepID=A0A0J6FM93_COCPO|nr:hypothetical protein CPAG_07805 [Coccidioides posadasii RMSCC 3488]
MSRSVSINCRLFSPTYLGFFTRIRGIGIICKHGKRGKHDAPTPPASYWLLLIQISAKLLPLETVPVQTSLDGMWKSISLMTPDFVESNSEMRLPMMASGTTIGTSG